MAASPSLAAYKQPLIVARNCAFWNMRFCARKCVSAVLKSESSPRRALNTAESSNGTVFTSLRPRVGRCVRRHDLLYHDIRQPDISGFSFRKLAAYANLFCTREHDAHNFSLIASFALLVMAACVVAAFIYRHVRRKRRRQIASRDETLPFRRKASSGGGRSDGHTPLSRPSLYATARMRTRTVNVDTRSQSTPPPSSLQTPQTSQTPQMSQTPSTTAETGSSPSARRQSASSETPSANRGQLEVSSRPRSSQIARFASLQQKRCSSHRFKAPSQIFKHATPFRTPSG